VSDIVTPRSWAVRRGLTWHVERQRGGRSVVQNAMRRGGRSGGGVRRPVESRWADPCGGDS